MELHPLDKTEPAIKLLRLAGRAMVADAVGSGWEGAIRDAALGISVGIDVARGGPYRVHYAVMRTADWCLIDNGVMTLDEIAKNKTTRRSAAV